jgi:hypothetical protein
MSLNTFNTFDVSDVPSATPTVQVSVPMTLPPQVFTNALNQVQMPTPVAASALDYNRRRQDQGANHMLRQIPRSSPNVRHSPLYTFRPRFVTESWLQAIRAAGVVPPAPPPAMAAPPGTTPAPADTTAEAKSAMDFLASINPFTDVSGKLKGSAAVYADTTHVANASTAAFQPTNIPVEGQPFFGAPARANLVGTGSAIHLTASNGTSSGTSPAANTPVLASGLLTVTDTTASGPSVTLQQAFLQIGNIIAGTTETAFADPGAVPITFDLAGPNARVTVGDNGQPGGQGRLGWFILQTPPDGPGSELSINLETPKPEILAGSNPAPVKNLSTFSRYPDITAEYRYGGSIYDTKPYEETWHVQLAGVIRDLGLENANQTLERHETGWGLSLSGEFGFLTPVSPYVSDRIYASVTYGQGIAHYIGDLHGANNDAVLTADRSLDALTDLGCYVGYTHNWTEWLRSTVTYSHVTLGSKSVAGQPSPYHFGDYFEINLVYHILTTGQLFPPQPMSTNPNAFEFYTGIEYLYGRKETLDRNAGDDQRIMWVTSIYTP